MARGAAAKQGEVPVPCGRAVPQPRRPASQSRSTSAGREASCSGRGARPGGWVAPGPEGRESQGSGAVVGRLTPSVVHVCPGRPAFLDGAAGTTPEKKRPPGSPLRALLARGAGTAVLSPREREEGSAAPRLPGPGASLWEAAWPTPAHALCGDATARRALRPHRRPAVMMSDVAQDSAAGSWKTGGSVSSLSSRELPRKEARGRAKDSTSSVPYMDEPSQRDEVSRLTVQMENTYQLGPPKHFPVATVNHILKEVLTNYLQEEEYEPELCRQMTKTISEVIKAQVKDLMVPRYKLIVIVHIGQLSGQSILIGSRCLWDPKNDNFSSYVFRNCSLFALANVYAVYVE
ncbi:tctex1 domain-containing protein 1 [Carlito syrichta]|uniref:Tctex1 domain-containing protein 1 n=1 Tax=Carlito syrichta TaxID=1868482 RepID=A0A3Q0DHV8_CARSF|nr:tctex1 domain-containing protein 1 [Carlito syrichta]